MQASINNERDVDRVPEPLIIQHPRFHPRDSHRSAKGKGKDSFERGDNSIVRWFRGKARANTLVVEKLGMLVQVPITRVTHPLKITVMMTTRLNRQMPVQAHNDPVDPGSDDGEEILNDDDDDEGNDTVSSYLALDDVTVLEAAELGAVALLADTWDNDLDPEMSAQLVQANAEAYLSFGKEKGKGKSKGKGRSTYPVRPSHLSLKDRRRRLRELREKIDCRACGRKRRRAHDRECAMSPSSSSTQSQTRTARMTTQQHLSNKTKKIGMCFVLSDYSDEPDTSAYMVGQNVPLPNESRDRHF